MSSVLRARIRAIPKHAKAAIVRYLPAPAVKSDPTNPIAWVAEAHAQFEHLPPDTQTLIANNDLHVGERDLTLFCDDIRSNAGEVLKQLASDLSPNNISEAIREIIRRKTIAQCAYSHRAGAYFDVADKFISIQWDRTIWPIISGEDMTHTLELACGHGRNADFLCRHASTIDLVDVNESCISACRSRFGDKMNGCLFRYHLTDGNNLRVIASSSITFVYSWDSMVHFDKLVIRDYISEIARVLKNNGTAFLHHSNYGTVAPNSDWTKNHGSRSDMTASLMRDYVAEAGMSIKFQRLSGRNDGWGIDDLDCLSLIQKH
jgi:ubiquinone/menaquinone biosynthesis C-methylase UbiE